MNKTVKSVASLVLLACFLVSLFSFPLSNAVSAQTNGLGLNGFDTNSGTYAKVGTLNIYAFDNKLVFYTDSAVLSKTWDIPNTVTKTYVSGQAWANSSAVQQTYLNTKIAAFNSTHLLVAQTFFASFYYGANHWYEITVCQWFFLNVNSLSYTSDYVYGYYAYDATIQPQAADLALFVTSTQALIAFGEKVSTGNANTYFVIQVFPSWSYLSTNNADSGTNKLYHAAASSAGAPAYTGNEGNNRALFGETISFQDSTNTTGYFISRNSPTGTQFCIYAVTLSNGHTAYLGSSPQTDQYGTAFTYFGGFIEQTLSGTNSFIDVLISFGYTYGSFQVMTAQLIRFNATSITVPASLSSTLSTTGLLRVMGVTSTSLTAFDALTDGTYISIYFNNVYAEYYYPYIISDLNTDFPQINGGGSILSFQGNIFHIAGSPVQVGGLIDAFATIGVTVDYTNLKCVAYSVTPLVSTLTYTYSWSPAPSYETQTLVQLLGSTTYVYTGHIDVNGVNGQGTATLLNLNSSTITVIKSLDSNGNFTFTFATPAVSIDSFFLISIALTNFNGNYAFTLETLILAGSSVTATPYPFPTYNGGSGGTGGGGGVLDGTTVNYNLNIFVNFFLLFICIVAPAILLGVMAGTVGFLGGAVLGLGVGVLAGLLPFWFIFLVGLAIVAVLFYGKQQSQQKTGGTGIDG
jgi:hypothetical protein